MAEYEAQYKAFSQNISFAARTLHCYLFLNKRAAENNIYEILNRNARFWSDYNYMALQTVIIFLGKIFDDDSKAHSIYKLLNEAGKNISYFSKEELRKRKVKVAGEFSGIGDYINNAHELSHEDLKEIRVELAKARSFWDKIKPLRDKVYAHNEMLDDKDLSVLFKEVQYSHIEEVVKILGIISHALQQAEINGKKPDLTIDYKMQENTAEKEIERLLSMLQKNEKIATLSNHS